MSFMRILIDVFYVSFMKGQEKFFFIFYNFHVHFKCNLVCDFFRLNI